MEPDRHTLTSRILSEELNITVTVPTGYPSGEEAYPAIYLLDADNLHGLASGLTDYYTRTSLMPPALLVGIASTDRQRDYTPTPGRRGTGGGADAFTRFLREELIPEIETRYRTTSYRALIGHSLAGLYAVHALTRHTDLFNATIALSPYVNWKPEPVLEAAREYARSDKPHRLLYTATEKMTPERETPILKLMETLKGSTNLESEYRSFPDADHMSLVAKALPYALEYVFPGFVQER